MRQSTARHDQNATVLQRTLRIFLSSPSDVAEERQRARKLIERLNKDHLLKGRFDFEAVSWEDPDVPPFMLKPQQAVNRGLAKPSDCDIVVVLFWNRMGTELDRSEGARANGEPYRSGTEWELENALSAPTQPDRPVILLYRRSGFTPDASDPDDPKLKEQLDQRRKVNAFFQELRQRKQFATEVAGADEFEKRLENDLKRQISLLLERSLSIHPPAVRGRIFLAHASEDKAQIRKLHQDLKARGFDPWLDEVDLIPGQIWKIEVPKAIREAKVFLACLSTRSVEKVGYVQNEFKLALAAFGERPPGSIYLIPARLDDCVVPDLQLPDLGIGLRDIQWVDLWEEGGFDQLVRAIESALPASKHGTRRLQSEPASVAAHGRPAVEIVSPPALRSPPDEDLLSSPINESTLEDYTKWKYPHLPVNDEIQALLLRNLDNKYYKVIGDLDCVVNAASEAVKVFEQQNPDRFKSGTDYLTKSLGFYDDNFRSRHPFSRQTLEAFRRYWFLIRSNPEVDEENALK
jgi:hypothetical protein